MRGPFLLLLFRLEHGPDVSGKNESTGAFADAIRSAFASTEAASIAEISPLLNAAELREFAPKKNGDDYRLPDQLTALVLAAESVLAVVLDADTDVNHRPSSSTPNAFELKLLKLLGSVPHSSVVSFSLHFEGSLFEKHPRLDRLRRFGLSDLGERDLLVPLVALHTLNATLRLLTASNRRGRDARTRVFFSHAKKDGVPIATTARAWMREHLKGFASFYDTKDLKQDKDIASQLSAAIKSCIIVVFRTEILDQRHWCQKEVLWAEEERRPVVTVDARWQLQHKASVITFDTVPAVRVPDGSLVRVFMAALHEAVRVELFRARVRIACYRLSEWAVEWIPRCPSLVSIHRALKRLREKPGRLATKACLVYPNPPLPAMLSTAARDLASWSVPSCEVLSFDEFTSKNL